MEFKDLTAEQKEQVLNNLEDDNLLHLTSKQINITNIVGLFPFVESKEGLTYGANITKNK